MSQRSKEFTDLIGVKSFITAPIVFKGKSLGILVVDNVDNKRPLTLSDMNLLSGIAQQIGISINNARSFIQLQASEEKYRELISTSIDGIISVDPQMRVIIWNQGAEKIFGYTEREMLGQNAMKIIPEIDRKRITRAFADFSKIRSGQDKNRVM